MEEDSSTTHYHYEFGQLIQADGHGVSSSDLPSTAPQSTHSLPSFEGIFASMLTEKKDPEASLDHSSTASDRSFTIDSLIGGDSSSIPRASTPTSPCYTKTSQSEPGATPTVTTTSQWEPSSTTEPQVFWAQTVSSLCRPPVTAEAQPAKLKRPHYKRSDDKPPYTYSALCAAAILMSEQQALSLADIRVTLAAMFPFFRGHYTGWRESVRHCLSHAKYFTCQGVPGEGGSEPSRRMWTVNRHLLKPTMFRRTRNTKEAAESYRMFLHEELGVSPLCPDADQTVQPAKKRVRTTANLKLPEHACYQEEAILGTQVVDADDFLRARKEVYADTDDVGSVTSPRDGAGSVASEWSVESMCGKRKQDSSGEPSAKKARTSTQPAVIQTTPSPAPGYDFSSVPYFPGYGAFDSRHYHSAQYPHYQMAGYQNPNYQMPPYYPPVATQPTHLYRQPHVPAVSGDAPGTTWGDVTSGIYQAPYQGRTAGIQAAMQLWQYRQMLAQQTYNYNYSWYNPPEEKGVDLTVPTSEEEK